MDTGAARDAMRRRARALYCAALVALLAAVQLRAQVVQLRAGYRPLAHAPTRVPYSWDMFAIRMDRCAVRWDPPLEIEGRRVASWHDRAYPIEFDTVFDQARQYLAAAAAGCNFRTSPETTVTLVCARSLGWVDTERYACPPIGGPRRPE